MDEIDESAAATARPVELALAQGIRVYRYGAPTRGGRRTYHLPPEAKEQLRLAQELKNRLVELSIGKDEAIAAIWSGYPTVAAAEAELALAEEAAATATEAVQKEKAAQRTRAPKGPAMEAQRAARQRAKSARLARRAAIDEIKADAKTQLTAVDADHKAAIKSLYGEFSQTRGLYWATFNDVADHSRAADRRIIEIRKQRRPARRRFRRWDGSGSLAVQLQREAGRPQRTPQLLASDASPWRTQLKGPFTDIGNATILFGLGSKLPPVEVPVKIHRAIPEDADIVGARLVVERVAGNHRIAVHITAKVPIIARTPQGPAVAIHLGWRRDDDGAIRVATWRSNDDLTVPLALRDIVTQDTAHSGRLLLSTRWQERMNRFDQIRSCRDIALTEIKEFLVTWLTEHPLPVDEDDEHAITAGRIQQWRAPGRFAKLAQQWRQEPPADGMEEIVEQLNTWRVADRRAWEREVNGRQKAIGHRRKSYERVAAWLARDCAQILVEDTDLASIIRKGKQGVLPGMVEDRAASQRTDAAPGELRAIIGITAAREQVPIIEVDHTGITLTHHGCGYRNPPDERWATDAKVLCDGCGRTFDQDANATIGMLARAAQPSRP